MDTQLTGAFGAIQLPTASGASMPNLAGRRVFGSALAAGQNDLYTVPAGKRLGIMFAQPFQTAGATGTIILQVKIGGVYYPLHTALATVLNTANAGAQIGFIAEAGDIISVLTTGTTQNVSVQCFEFDATSSLRSVRLVGSAAGPNVLYTVPALKTAIIWGIALIPNFPTVAEINDAGGTHTFTLFIVPSGGALPDTAHTIAISGVIAASARNSASCQVSLEAGDTLQITPSGAAATQFFWVNVYEL